MEAYERLRTEIIRSAVFDLRSAMKKSDRLGFVCDEQKNMERWFLSSWGQLLSGDTGEYIIEKCRQTYKARTHPNGKKIMPDEKQKEIYAYYRMGMSHKKVCIKYGISRYQLNEIIRRWGNER